MHTLGCKNEQGQSWLWGLIMRTDKMNSKDCISDSLLGTRIMKDMHKRPKEQTPFSLFSHIPFWRTSRLSDASVSFVNWNKRQRKANVFLVSSLLCHRLIAPAVFLMHVGERTDACVWVVCYEMVARRQLSYFQTSKERTSELKLRRNGVLAVGKKENRCWVSSNRLLHMVQILSRDNHEMQR